MSRYTRAILVVLGAMTLIAAPAPSSAQSPSADWSRIMRTRWCPPEQPCPAREGLVWDSTNTIPQYPAIMREVGVGGEAVLKFHVRPDGTVDSSSVSLVRTSNNIFIHPSISAVHHWRFEVETEGRPSTSIPVEVQLIYAHEGDCRGSVRPQHTGWAAQNQLVIGVCVVSIPRSQLRRQG